MSLLTVQNLSHSFGDNLLFKNLSFSMVKGERIGLVGHNGCGKSTFLKMLIGEIIQDSGSIDWHPKIKIGYLDQHAEVDLDLTIITYLRSAFAELYETEQEMQRINDEICLETDDNQKVRLIEKAAALRESLENAGFNQLESHIKKVCAGLGITAIGMDRQIAHLSGGQRTKVILAKLLLRKLDVLLLDEPTNFLDIPHIEWLSKYLKTYNGAFIVISHNFDFLDAVASCICEIELYTMTRYSGNLTFYLASKNKRKEQYIKEYNFQQKLIKSTEEFIAKNKVRASTSNRAKSREKMLDKIERIAAPRAERKVFFNFAFSPLPNERILQVTDLEVGYGSPLLPKLSFEIKNGEKMMVTGFNGIGKSTLIKTIIGDLPKISGKYEFSKNVKIGYFQQDYIWESETLTPYNYLLDWNSKLTRQQIFGFLAQVGVTKEHINRPIVTLSGGEQAKVRMCRLINSPCNLLVLDEPTNHLDAAAKESLKISLEEFPGCVLMISHEIDFFRSVTDKILDIEKLFD